MNTYRTRAQKVEAVQWTGENEGDIMDFFPFAQFVWEGNGVVVHDKHSGYFAVEQYAWIVRTPNGFVSIYDPGNFAAYYEEDDSLPTEAEVLHMELLPGPEAAITDWVNKAGWASYLKQTVRCQSGEVLCMFALPPDVMAARQRGELVPA